MKKYIKSDEHWTLNFDPQNVAYSNARYKTKWLGTKLTLYFDNAPQVFTMYSRDVDGNTVYVKPEYNKKTDLIDWKIEFIDDSLNLSKVSGAFETFYDAMDFVDSGEMADMYL